MCVYVHTYVHAYVYIYIRIYIYIYVCAYIYIYICKCVYVYVNISYMQILGYTWIVQPRLLGLELSQAYFSTTRRVRSF